MKEIFNELDTNDPLFFGIVLTVLIVIFILDRRVER